jgi:hypothetical protein
MRQFLGVCFLRPVEFEARVSVYLWVRSKVLSFSSSSFLSLLLIISLTFYTLTQTNKNKQTKTNKQKTQTQTRIAFCGKAIAEPIVTVRIGELSCLKERPLI